jgi:hypothetical protein
MKFSGAPLSTVSVKRPIGPPSCRLSSAHRRSRLEEGRVFLRRSAAWHSPAPAGTMPVHAVSRWRIPRGIAARRPVTLQEGDARRAAHARRVAMRHPHALAGGKGRPPPIGRAQAPQRPVMVDPRSRHPRRSRDAACPGRSSPPWCLVQPGQHVVDVRPQMVDRDSGREQVLRHVEIGRERAHLQLGSTATPRRSRRKSRKCCRRAGCPRRTRAPPPCCRGWRGSPAWGRPRWSAHPHPCGCGRHSRP